MELHFYFNEAQDRAQIIPSGAVTLQDVGTGVLRVPEFLLHFEMSKNEEDGGQSWQRNSWVGGMSPFSFTYNLKRIIDGDGKRAMYWDEYMDTVPPTGLITKRMRSFFAPAGPYPAFVEVPFFGMTPADSVLYVGIVGED